MKYCYEYVLNAFCNFDIGPQKFQTFTKNSSKNQIMIYFHYKIFWYILCWLMMSSTMVPSLKRSFYYHPILQGHWKFSKNISSKIKTKNIVNTVCLHVLLFISHVHDSSSLYGLMQVYHSVTISWHRISILFRFHNEVKEKTTIKLEATSILPFNMCVWIFSCPCINCWFHRLLMEWNKPWMMLTLLFQYSIP